MPRAAKVPAFTLLELTLKRSLTSILSKPQWWRKWPDAEISRKWRDEFAREFLLQTLTQSRQWRPNECFSLDNLREALASDEREARVAAWCEHVRYELQPERAAHTGGDDDNEDDEDDDDDDEKKPNAYTFIVWYFTYAVLRETVRAMPASDWSAETLQSAIAAAESRSGASIVPRSLAFLLAVRTGGATDESVRAALAGVETRDTVIAQLRERCAAVFEELCRAENYIAQVLDELSANERLLVQVAPGESPVVVSPAGIHGVWLCDELIPAALKSQLAQQVAVLEDVPDAAKDWHPNTHEQVLDLVHPSLFCCEFGQTKRLATPLPPDACSSAAEHMLKIIGGASVLVDDAFQDASARKSAFQWIPSDVLVHADGSARILSYVNNLHPVRFAALYTALEGVFTRFVPLLERAVAAAAAAASASASAHELLGPELDSPEDFNSERPVISDTMVATTLASMHTDSSANVSLRGRTVQVIVKIAEIVLTPDKPTYAGGAWHIEGTDAEQIAATGIYYFGSDNIADSRLAFRVNVQEPWYEQSDDSGVAVMYGLANDDLLAQTLGSVATLEDRCLVFPNVVQHRVEPFALADPTQRGMRKIVAFFVVDPAVAIPSTAMIPPQQREWVDEVQAPLLKRLRMSEIAEDAVKVLASGDTRTLEEAKVVRARLMAERSTLAEPDPGDYESYFSLCEH